MADDFLKKYNTTGMTLDEIKKLLGEPDFEQDNWSYSLSAKGVPPPGPHNKFEWLEYPQLYVALKEGRADGLSVTYGLSLKNEMSFNSQLWKGSKPSEKLKMAASLMDSGILKGHDKDEVQRLLGPPDGRSEKHEIEYDLGFRIVDMVTLTLTLAGDETVSHAEVIEH